MSTLQTDCLYSSVRKLGAGSLHFHFLPPHGKTLALNQEYTIIGNILDAVTLSHRKIHAKGMLARAIYYGDLEIKYTPSPILEDPTRDTSRMLRIKNGGLGTQACCWANSSVGSLPTSVV